MTDLAHIATLARTIHLTEDTVDTDRMNEALRGLKTAIDDAHTGIDHIDTWLRQEHAAGVVINAAATMNKRGEVAGKGYPFDRANRAEIIAKFNRWADQFVSRLESFEAGRADLVGYIARLNAFNADTVRKEP